MSHKFDLENYALTILSSTTGINGLVAAGVNLNGIIPTGKIAIVTGAVVRMTAASGLTGSITMSIGDNTDQTVLFPSTTLTGFNATTELFEFVAQGTRQTMIPGNGYKINISTPFGGALVTLAIELFGYFV